mgnify:CR=1 FL=1
MPISASLFGHLHPADPGGGPSEAWWRRKAGRRVPYLSMLASFDR